MKKSDKMDINTNELNDVISLSKKILNVLYIVLIGSIVLASLFLVKYLGILKFVLGILKVISPLFIGFVIAWLFNPLVCKLKEKGLSKILSAIIVYLVFLICLILFIRVFIPVLYNQINDLVAAVPGIFSKVEVFINDLVSQFNLENFNLINVKDNMMNSIETQLLGFMNDLPNIVINLIVNLFSGLGIVLLGLVVGLYMLFDFESITGHLLKMVPKKNRYEVSTLITNIGAEVRKTVNGTLLVALMVFITDSIGFSIVGLKAPVLFGLFCGLTDLIPYIGPYIGGAAAVVVGFSQGSVIGISVLIICIIVQLVESYILQPVVMSKAMQLHPVTIIVGLLIFGYFFGILGMIVATPCLALMKVLARFIRNKYGLFIEK